MHRLIEKAAREAGAPGFSIRRSDKGWTVQKQGAQAWQWAWAADFATHDDAVDYVAGKLAQRGRLARPPRII